MTLFQWGDEFFTNFASVDEQHYKLVELVNQLGDLFADSNSKTQDIEALITQLIDYSVYHFTNEEKLMAKLKIDTRHFKQHVKMHKKFINDIRFIYASLDIENRNQANIFLKFLAPWLGHHMLGVDQEMANQLKKIQSGMTPEQAYCEISEEAQGISESFIEVLYELFIQLATQNKELKELNDSLEEKVASRTKKLSESNAHLEKLSLTDPLTNLANRRQAMQSLPIIWQESVEKDQPLSCFMIDIDHFKSINDDFGHDAGDLVLVEIAETINEHIRTDDLLCRLGGDEFILICPNTNKSGAQQVAQLLLEKVRELKVRNHFESWDCSISIGGAARLANMIDFEELIKAADDALYTAKEAGKNCAKFNQKIFE